MPTGAPAPDATSLAKEPTFSRLLRVLSLALSNFALASGVSDDSARSLAALRPALAALAAQASLEPRNNAPFLKLSGSCAGGGGCEQAWVSAVGQALVHALCLSIHSCQC